MKTVTCSKEQLCHKFSLRICRNRADVSHAWRQLILTEFPGFLSCQFVIIYVLFAVSACTRNGKQRNAIKKEDTDFARYI